MRLADLIPTDDAQYGAERMFIAGQSGSGKSTLTRTIAERIPPTRDKRGELHGWCVVVIDSKRDWDHDGLWRQLATRIAGRPRGLWQALPVTDLRFVQDGYYVYRPKEFPERNDAGARRIFRTCLQRQYCVIIVDELADFGATSGIPELGKMIRQGRSKHCIIMCGTQRPAGIVLLAITEANKLAVFQLGSKDDLDRVAKWGYPAFATPPDGEHDFNYYDRRSRRFVRVRQGGESAA